MNHCAIQQNVTATRQDKWSSLYISDLRETVICPKPRRLGVQPEMFDSKAESDLLDLILSKGDNYGLEQSCTNIASSPPFLYGSPPSRVANPLIQDARFGEEKFAPFLPIPPPSGLSPSSSSARKGSCVRGNFGNKPAVRIEGFDCLDRDRRNRSIPALA